VPFVVNDGGQNEVRGAPLLSDGDGCRSGTNRQPAPMRSGPWLVLKLIRVPALRVDLLDGSGLPLRVVGSDAPHRLVVAEKCETRTYLRSQRLDAARRLWAGLLRLRVEPRCVSPLRAVIPREGSPLTPARRAHGRAGLRRLAPSGSLAKSDQSAPSSRDPNIRIRPLRGFHWARPVPVTGARALSSFTLRVNERA
jgi:hypothetical protein